MKHCDLPDDVVKLVLSTSLNCDSDKFSFKANLRLTAVCSQWRRLALPIVYGTEFVKIDEQPRDQEERVSDGDFGDEDNLRLVPTKENNLGLAVSVGCAHLVKAVAVTSFYVDHYLCGLGVLMKVMSEVGSTLPAARMLKIVMFMYPESSSSRGSAASYEEKIRGLGRALVTVMPGVTGLDLNRSNGAVLINSHFGQLTGVYTEQLERFEGSCSAMAKLNGKFKRLREVCIYRGKGDGHRLPHIDPARLLKLTIKKAPPTLTWDGFSKGCDFGDIEFSLLRSLRLDY
ncbi:hypothetical protein LPJ61_004998, partial [Coemansia biformis]